MEKRNKVNDKEFYEIYFIIFVGCFMPCGPQKIEMAEAVNFAMTCKLYIDQKAKNSIRIQYVEHITTTSTALKKPSRAS